MLLAESGGSHMNDLFAGISTFSEGTWTHQTYTTLSPISFSEGTVCGSLGKYCNDPKALERTELHFPHSEWECQVFFLEVLRAQVWGTPLRDTVVGALPSAPVPQP